MKKYQFWKAVEGHSRYRVNRRGEMIRKEYRTRTRLGKERIWPERLAKLVPDKAGFVRVCLGGNEGGALFVHREVAKAFIPNPHGYEYVKHIDGDKTNNRVSNLKWVSIEEARPFKGEGNPSAKLTPAEVLEIRRLAQGVLSKAELAKKYNVSFPHVHAIVERRVWSHL